MERRADNTGWDPATRVVVVGPELNEMMREMGA